MGLSFPSLSLSLPFFFVQLADALFGVRYVNPSVRGLSPDVIEFPRGYRYAAITTASGAPFFAKSHGVITFIISSRVGRFQSTTTVCDQAATPSEARQNGHMHERLWYIIGRSDRPAISFLLNPS